MNATNVLERVPIHTDADGVVRVAGTRVTLTRSWTRSRLARLPRRSRSSTQPCRWSTCTP
jgi:hypothetical protein